MYESGSGARQLAAKVESLQYMVSLCIILFVFLYLIMLYLLIEFYILFVLHCFGLLVFVFV